STARDTLRACEWGGEPLYGRGQTNGCLKERAASPETSHHPATGRAAITYKERRKPRAFASAPRLQRNARGQSLAASAAPAEAKMSGRVAAFHAHVQRTVGQPRFEAVANLRVADAAHYAAIVVLHDRVAARDRGQRAHR